MSNILITNSVPVIKALDLKGNLSCFRWKDLVRIPANPLWEAMYSADPESGETGRVEPPAAEI